MWELGLTSVEPTAALKSAKRHSCCASLSIDLDNEWAYLRSRGDPRWRSYPSYLGAVVPQMLDILKRRGLQVTFFMVGKDAENPNNRDSLASISGSGHEVGNHSFRHELWLSRYSEQELQWELMEAEQRLEETTGQRPRGFRGPGFNHSNETLKILAQRGYKYDASTFPSFLGPIARAYHLGKASFSQEERTNLGNLFGGWQEGLRPLKPYRCRLGRTSLIEIPVTTYPVLRMPIHSTYVMYLAGLSQRLAVNYFKSAMTLCRYLSVEPSILLHPIDFITGADWPTLAAFPGMRLDARRKRAVLEDCLDSLQDYWPVVSLEKHAAAIAERGDLPTLSIA